MPAGRLNPDFPPRFTGEAAKGAPVAVIGRSGDRPDALARKLAAQGHTRVYDVQGGFTGWMGDGHPVVRF